MKGRLLSYSEIVKLPHGTRVYLESKWGIQDKALINQKEEMIGNYENYGIQNCIYYFPTLESDNTIKVYEWLEEPESEQTITKTEKETNTYTKTYKGSEILRMIEDGRLKDEDILIADNVEYTFEEFEYIMIKDLINYNFTIKQKPVDFMTAVNSGKNIRPVNLANEKKFHTYIYWLGFMVSGCAYHKKPLDLINGLWEIEY